MFKLTPDYLNYLTDLEKKNDVCRFVFFFTHIFLYMLAVAGQTAELNWLNSFERTQ